MFLYIYLLILSMKLNNTQVSEFLNGNIVSKYSKSTINELEISKIRNEKNMSITFTCAFPIC